jgi:hypothetical protein
MSIFPYKDSNKDRLCGKSGRLTDLICTGHVNLSADMRNLKAKNCRNVLDISTDGPLEMKACTSIYAK